MNTENNTQVNEPASDHQDKDPNMVVEPGQGIPPASIDNGAKKTPLVTIAAQLTFKGDEAQKPKTLAGKIFGIIIVIVALVGAGGSVYAAQYVKNARQLTYEEQNPSAAKLESDIKQAIKDSGPDTQDGIDGKVDVSKLFDARLGQHEQDVKAAQNKQINISNGFSFMVTGVERNWNTGSKYKVPNKGKEFVKIAVSVGSRSKNGYQIGTNIGFNAVNSKGGVLEEETLSKTIIPDNELVNNSDSMNGGDVRNGWVVFEVDQGEKITLVYESTGTTSGDPEQKEFIMKGSVEIQ